MVNLISKDAHLVFSISGPSDEYVIICVQKGFEYQNFVCINLLGALNSDVLRFIKRHNDLDTLCSVLGTDLFSLFSLIAILF